jgi:hypothetical protein
MQRLVSQSGLAVDLRERSLVRSRTERGRGELCSDALPGQQAGVHASGAKRGAGMWRQDVDSLSFSDQRQRMLYLPYTGSKTGPHIWRG